MAFHRFLFPYLSFHAPPDRPIQALQPLSVLGPMLHASPLGLYGARLSLQLPKRDACSHYSPGLTATSASGRGVSASPLACHGCPGIWSRGCHRISLSLSLRPGTCPDSPQLLFRPWQRLLVRQSFLAIPHGLRLLRRPILRRLSHQLLAPRIWRMAGWQLPWWKSELAGQKWWLRRQLEPLIFPTTQAGLFACRQDSTPHYWLVAWITRLCQKLT